MTIEKATEIAAQTWCHDTTKDIAVAPELAVLFAKTLVEETRKAEMEIVKKMLFIVMALDI